MFSLLRLAVALGAVRATHVCAIGTYKMTWSTDKIGFDGGGLFGPDGPWQAIQVEVGAYSYSVSFLRYRQCQKKYHCCAPRSPLWALTQPSCGRVGHLRRTS